VVNYLVYVMKNFFKHRIEYYIQYVQAWTLVIGKNEFKKYIFTIVFKYLGTKHRVIMWQTQCYFFHNYNKWVVNHKLLFQYR